MKRTGLALLALVTLSAPVAAADDDISIELNTASANQDRCRLSFVIGNPADSAIESLKLDLVVFNRDGAIDRRLVAEMAPLRATKTIVKTFELAGACDSIGSVLVNDVTACAPGDVEACLGRLKLSSRIPNVRLFK